MPFKIKLDENLPRQAAQVAREHGYDAASVLEQGMSGWKDSRLWREVQEEGRFLITADKGFADIRVYPPGKHHGLLLLRPDEDGVRPVLELLQQVLNAYNLGDLTGTTTIVTPRGIRIRKA